MKHYLITNRPIIIDGNGKETINKEDNDSITRNIRYATYDIESKIIEIIPDLDKGDDGKFKRPEYGSLNQKTELKGSELFHKLLYDNIILNKDKTHNDTLFFIHGFNNDTDEVLSIIEKLHILYVNDPECPIVRIVAFSWPSNGSITDYNDDKPDAVLSGSVLARSYQKLMRFFANFLNDENPACESNLHLLCHSMGNLVFETMLKELEATKYPLIPVFKEIILAASDIDNDAFAKGKPLYNITDIGKRVHVYYNENDRALMISEKTKNKKNRLGKGGPANIAEVRNGINFVDTSEVADIKTTIEKITTHAYYKESKTVVADIKQVLLGIHTEKINPRTYLTHKGVFRI